MFRLTLVRHATLLIELAGQTVLLDPMLDGKEAQPPVAGTFNPQRYPLVPLPFSADDVVSRADAVALTHTHVDHLDETAIEAIRERDVPVFCQPPDESQLNDFGFADVRPVQHSLTWRGIDLTRVDGCHGTGDLAALMAPASGFVFQAGADRLYVAGDTVWCDHVRQTISEYAPTVVVVNAGEARMLEGDPITMDAADVVGTARHHATVIGAGNQHTGRVVAVHMEALNHCVLTRAVLAAETRRSGVRVDIPADGDELLFDANY